VHFPSQFVSQEVGNFPVLLLSLLLPGNRSYCCEQRTEKQQKKTHTHTHAKNEKRGKSLGPSAPHLSIQPSNHPSIHPLTPPKAIGLTGVVISVERHGQREGSLANGEWKWSIY